jgi:protein-S-isoprenylcysteine O-methyltransferase Ste14
MTIDRILVPLAVVLGIGAGTVLPILRASAKTGTSGLTFQQPRRDARERLIGTVVGALGAAHLAWGPLYAWLGPGPLGVTLPSAAVMWSGFALYLASLVVVIQAQATMGKSWRIGIDRGATSLVTEGVYAIVRNPIYVGAIGCGWAMVIMTPSWITVAGALGYLVFIQLQARLEERHLLALHGASYRRYLEDVGRFLPLPSRHLGRSEVRVLAALAEAVIPGGTKIPAGGAQTVALVEEALDRGPALSSRLVRLALFSVQVMSVVTRGSRFTALSPGKREEALARWLEHAPGVSRHALRGLVALVKTAHFDHEATARAVAIPPSRRRRRAGTRRCWMAPRSRRTRRSSATSSSWARAPAVRSWATSSRSAGTPWSSSRRGASSGDTSSSVAPPTRGRACSATVARRSRSATCSCRCGPA